MTDPVDLDCVALDAEVDCSDLLGRLACSRARFALIAAKAEPLAPGVEQLIRRLRNGRAVIGFGAVLAASGRRIPFPTSIDDLRFRLPPAARLVVVERRWLTETLHACGWAPDDPDRHWRLLRAAASGAAVRTEAAIGQLVGADSDPSTDRLASVIPLGSAAPRFEPGPASDSILVYGVPDIGVALCFDALPLPVRQRLRFLRPCDPVTDLPALATAALVIVAGDFEFFVSNGTPDLLEALQVPFAVFASTPLGREAWQSFALLVARSQGVLAASSEIAERCIPLGRPILEWFPVFDDLMAETGWNPVSPPCQGGARFGLIGGILGRQALEREILPALDRLIVPQLDLYVRSDVARGIGDLRVRAEPVDGSLAQRVRRWAAIGCRAVLDPGSGPREPGQASAFTPLLARYLGAVPIVGEGVLREGVGEAEGVLVATGGVPGWAATLQIVLAEDSRTALLRALDDWCRATFDGGSASRRWDELRSWSDVVTERTRELRLARALGMPGFAGLDPRYAAEPMTVQVVAPSAFLPMRTRLAKGLLRRAREFGGRVRRHLFRDRSPRP